MNSKLRARLYYLLEQRDGTGPLGPYVDGFLVVLIVLNVLAVILESVPDIAAVHGFWFQVFDHLSVVVFTIEYLARVWVVVEDPHKTPYGDFFGEIGVMMNRKRTATVTAITETRLMVLEAADMRRLMAEHEILEANLQKVLAVRVSELENIGQL
jgi:voltage-gated potassium channel